MGRGISTVASRIPTSWCTCLFFCILLAKGLRLPLEWPAHVLFPLPQTSPTQGPRTADPECCWHLRCNKWPGVLPLSLVSLGVLGGVEVGGSSLWEEVTFAYIGLSYRVSLALQWESCRVSHFPIIF